MMSALTHPLSAITSASWEYVQMPKSPLRITALAAAIAGIGFPATQSPSADANTLDDYEEGTFTPTLSFSTPGNLAVTYAIQKGRYTKIGRLVHYQINLQTSAFTHSTASGNLEISGLPFTAINEPNCGLQVLLQRGISAGTVQQFTVAAGMNTAKAFIYGSRNDGAIFLTIGSGQLPSGSVIDWYISGTYETAN